MINGLLRWRSILYYPNIPFGNRKPTLFHNSAALFQHLIKFNLSDIGEGIAEVQLKEWHVNIGDQINEFDEICSVQSDKAAVTITSRYTGKIRKLYYNVDDVAKVGQPLVDIEVVADDDAKPAIDVLDDNSNGIIDKTVNKLIATPAVRRLVREYDLKSTEINGTGKGGRVLKEDVLRFLNDRTEVAQSQNVSQEVESLESNASFIDQQYFGNMAETKSSVKTLTKSSESILSAEERFLERDKIVPIRGYTRTMMKTMTESLNIPHFGYCDEFVVDKLMEVRATLNTSVSPKKDQKLRLTFLPLIIKAVSLALRKFPSLNASIDAKMENLIYKADHNISIAVDTIDGLIVPNIKKCQEKNIWEISSELDRIVSLAKLQKLSREDLQGGTFSLSNIGAMNGCTYASPIILPPQVAIGAIGRIRKVPRFDAKGNLVPMHIMHFSWAADHRVVDGATVARFSNLLRQFIEEPNVMLAEMS